MTINGVKNFALEQKLRSLPSRIITEARIKMSEISGTATITIGNTSVTVSHGVGSTPNWINVMPQDENGLGWYVTAIGATTFQINIQVPQLGNADYIWSAGK